MSAFGRYPTSTQRFSSAFFLPLPQYPNVAKRAPKRYLSSSNPLHLGDEIHPDLEILWVQLVSAWINHNPPEGYVMNSPANPASSIDTLTKVLTLISLGLATFATWKALPYDTEIKRLQAETQRLDLALKQADADLKGLESSRKITLELYQEVKNVIQKKDKDQREEEAVRVLVESLADDPFRWKLLSVIANGAQSEAVKQAASETSTYYKEESLVRSELAPPAAPAPSSGIGTYNVDFFYCEDKTPSSESVARSLLSLKTSSSTGRWRVRALPVSINEKPGYGIKSNIIRFTPPEEKSAAQALAKLVESKGVNLQLQEISFPTPGYISVFICQ
jgi:hypothetical protein